MSSDKKFIICKASAGSGKTFKLVGDYLALCLKSESPLYFSRILAITFTNKAATEMKERIIEHLRALSSEINSENYRNDWMSYYMQITNLTPEIIQKRSKKILENILHRYTSLSVSTIDKFTHKLIRSFARDLRIAADFEILLDPRENLEKSTEELISLAGFDSEVTEILEQYMEFLSDESENWNPEKHIFKFGEQLLDEESARNIDKIEKLTHEDFQKIIVLLKEKITVHESKIKTVGESFREFCDKYNLTVSDFYYGSGGPAKHFGHILRKNYSHDTLTVGKRDITAQTENRYFNSENEKSIPANIKSEAENIFNQLYIILRNDQPKYMFYLLLRRNVYNLSLIGKFSAKLKEINATENTLLIGEFNRIISEVIMNDPAPFIYERIGERYNHILVDEFQDTSVLQFNNLLPLISNSLSGNNTCMLVGDPKQAIYRWRGGDIDQFLRLPKINPDISEEIASILETNSKQESLDANYRSGKTIVEFNNRFFAAASANLNEAYRKIYENLQQKSVHDGGYVELTLYPEKHPDVNENILLNIEEKIKDCLADGFNYSDIAIIYRRNYDGKRIASMLHEKNIPAVSGESLLLSANAEVNLIMYFISHLAHPQDAEASFQTAEYFFRCKGENIPESFITRKKEFRKNPALYLESCGIKYNRNYLLNLTSYLLVKECIRILCPESNSIHLRFLIEFVYAEWKNHPSDVLELCRWWQEKSGKLSVINEGNGNAVRLMTIHASKGLQFPVVLFPFATWKPKNGREWLWVDLKKDGIPLETAVVKSNSSYLDNSNHAALKTKEKEKTTLDDLNLWYVAMTRPEKRLYILSENTSLIKSNEKFFTAILNSDSEYVWNLGQKEKYKGKIISEKNTFSVQKSGAGAYTETMQLSLTPDGKTEQNEVFRMKRCGIFLHSVFEKCKNKEEAFFYLNKQSAVDSVIRNSFESLSKEIKNVYNHEAASFLFSGSDSLNECSVVDENGKTFRPDKIILKDNSAIICDFKTGVFNEKHAVQLSEYGDLFSKMGYKSVKKYLFYTSEAKLMEV